MLHQRTPVYSYFFFSIMISLTAADLVCPSSGTTTTTPPRKAKRLRRIPGGKFLKGPLPWSWIVRAGALPGKALHLGLTLWQEAGCRGSRVVSANQSTIATEFACDRATIYRGLHALEEAGLVRVVESRPGRKLVVELLDGGEGTNDTDAVPATRQEGTL
jgi:hypothetical protein